MKKNKYKIKKWVLIPIFILMCSLVLGFGYSKPIKALNSGFNDNNGVVEWYSTMPTEIVAEMVENSININIPFDSYYPSFEEATSSNFSPLEVIYDFNTPSGIGGVLHSNVFLDNSTININDNNYIFYDNLVTLEGGGNGTIPAPFNLQIKYNGLIFPYGYTGSEINQWGNERPIRTEEQLNIVNSDFYTNMAVYLYKPIGVSEYNVHFNNVYIKYAVMKPKSFQGGVDDSVNYISNSIEYNTYNWTYSNDNNYYLNPYDNTLYPILTEDEQYYKIDLYNLLRMIIDTEEQNNFSNGEYVGKYLVYFPLISVNCHTDILYMTLDRVFAVGGSVVAETGSFYNNENEPFSSLYIDALDYMSYYNYVVPNIATPKPVDMTSWILTSVGAFINAEIFPGFAIGGILAVLVALPLAIWLIKIILGG